MSRSVVSRDGRFELVLFAGPARTGGDRRRVTVIDHHQRTEGDLAIDEAHALRAALVELLIGVPEWSAADGAE